MLVYCIGVFLSGLLHLIECILDLMCQHDGIVHFYGGVLIVRLELPSGVKRSLNVLKHFVFNVFHFKVALNTILFFKQMK